MAETVTLSGVAQITHRGLVLFTEHWSGTPRRGDRILLPDGKGGVCAERITAIEDARKLDARGQPVPCIGLLVGHVPEDEIDGLEALLTPGMTLTVEPLLDPIAGDANPGSLAERLHDALDTAVARAGKGYFDAPLPNEVDEDIGVLMERFPTFNDASRAELIHRVSQAQMNLLISYAVRMASLAVRERSLLRLRTGLLAMALASHAREFDWREVILSFSTLEDAGRRLGRRAGPGFDEAAKLADPSMARMIRGGSPGRWLLLRLLRRIRIPGVPVVQEFKLLPSPDGPRYAPTPRITEEDLVRRVVQGHVAYYGRALEAYRRDNGRYPTTEQGLDALCNIPTSEPVPHNWKGPYTRVTWISADPWREPYVYRCPGEHNPEGYDLYSRRAEEWQSR